MATREANTKGGTLESGTTYKTSAKDESSMKNTEGTQRPMSAPVTSAPNGQKIK